MYGHHQQTINNITQKFKDDSSVIALLVGGSIAHGYALEISDVDILIVVTDEEYKRREKLNDLLYLDFENCTYEGGYIDGKYLNLEFMELVAQRGSEPARYAFKDVIVVFSKDNRVTELVKRIDRFPVQKKEENIKRFLAQMNAWRWMFNEAVKHKNNYLVNRATTNFVLFSVRVILAHNELLYPFHKWMMKELERAKIKPENMVEIINDIFDKKTAPLLDELFNKVKASAGVPFNDEEWGKYFLKDSEQNWIHHEAPVADI